MSEELLFEVKGQTAWITLNREPKRNALSLEMIAAFKERLEQAKTDESIRAICVTNAGEKIFCSGADLGGTLGAGNENTGPAAYAGLLKTMAGYPKPVVGKINGSCLAGGIGLLLSLDISIARNDVYFSTPEVNVGLYPMMVGALLYRNVARKKADEMVMTGRKIFAEEAERIGLISRVASKADLDAKVNETLDALTAKSPIGLKLGKEAFFKMSDMPFTEGMDFLREKLSDVLATEDATEGLAAFFENRKPNFKGK